MNTPVSQAFARPSDYAGFCSGLINKAFTLLLLKDNKNQQVALNNEALPWQRGRDTHSPKLEFLSLKKILCLIFTKIKLIDIYSQVIKSIS